MIALVKECLVEVYSKGEIYVTINGRKTRFLGSTIEGAKKVKIIYKGELK